MAVSLRAWRTYHDAVESQRIDDDDSPWVPRRDEPIPPPWFERPREATPLEPEEAGRLLRFSWPRTLGLLALVLVIVGLPLDFAISYFGASSAVSRANMTLGFVWAVVIEALAVWGLIRLLTRR
jgi:hypothetical protein